MGKLFGYSTLSLICLAFFLVSIVTTVVKTNNDYNTTPATDWVLLGALTATSIDFRIQIPDQAVTRLVIRENANSTDFIYDESFTSPSSSGNIQAIHVENLTASSIYFYETSRSNVILQSGSFRTPAPEGEAFDFSFATAGCAWTGSKASVFETILENHAPLFLLHLGDFHYEDISVDDMQLRLDAVGKVLGSPSQQKLFANTPLANMWDDHDWLGNDSGADYTDQGARNTALISYQLAFPHYPLALNTSTDDPQPVSPYHAFTVGTVRFILTDLRSQSTSTSIMSQEQKDWFFQELSLADQYDFVIWVTTKPWIGEVNPGDDNWLGVPSNRSEVSEYISSVVTSQNLLVLSSDAHMLAFDDGSNTYYGNSTTGGAMSFPILQSGPFDRLGSAKGGPFTEGCTTVKYERNNQYSIVSYESSASDGPCLVATTYVDGAELFQKRMCGQIFTEAATKPEGTCEAETFSSSTEAVLIVSIVVAFLIPFPACCFMSWKDSIFIAMITWVGLVATLMAGAGIPLAKGVSQYDTYAIVLIGLVQMLVVGLYCGVWYCCFRKNKD